MCDRGYGINRISLCEPIENINELLNECRSIILVLATPKIKQNIRISEYVFCIRIPFFKFIGIICIYVKWPIVKTYIVGKARNSRKIFSEP